MFKFKIMRYNQELYPNAPLFGVCFVDTGNGNMAEGNQIVHILQDLETGRAVVRNDDLGWFILYE